VYLIVIVIRYNCVAGLSIN